MKLIDDVHTLARVYGWTELDVLGLRCRRRDAYLDRIDEEQDAELMTSFLGEL